MTKKQTYKHIKTIKNAQDDGKGEKTPKTPKSSQGENGKNGEGNEDRPCTYVFSYVISKMAIVLCFVCFVISLWTFCKNPGAA